MLPITNLQAKVLFILDFLRPQEVSEGKFVSGDREQILIGSLKRAGISSDNYSFTTLATARQDIVASEAVLLVPLGEKALQFVTGLTSIQKWHLSILKSKAEFGSRKTIPLLHPEHVQRSYRDIAYVSFGCLRIKKEMLSPLVSIPDRRFWFGPTFEETINILERKCINADTLAVDIETGAGQINTVGFAWSERNAIAVKVLPGFWTKEQFYDIWHIIARILESPTHKILQNFIFEQLWFSAYGIRLENVAHDTMLCMKFLHPEFDKGLDNVGRIYTQFPYWKDDNEDWADIKDWNRHLDYNCKDTTGTFAAYLTQKQALAERQMEEPWQRLVNRFTRPITEMCSRGLLLDESQHQKLLSEVNQEIAVWHGVIDGECLEQLGRKINTKSPQQLKKALKEMGMNLPTKYGAESTDKKALLKLRKKYPNEQIIPALIKANSATKLKSTYLEFDYDRSTRKLHYTLNGCGDATGRWSAHNDPFGRGLNPQTLPQRIRNLFIAETGKRFIQVKLVQAENYFLAWDSPEPVLMDLLLSKRDLYEFIASRIFNKPEEIVSPYELKVAKKTVQAANYGIGPRTFSEDCLAELGSLFSEKESKRILSTYLESFPGIKRRQNSIQETIRRTKKLTTPLGRNRIFYDRISDSMFREAYAYAPKSTVTDVINSLIIELQGHCELLLQMDKSILVQVEHSKEQEVFNRIAAQAKWHPKLTLAGGDLVLPIVVESGDCWGRLKRVCL